ncbi:MAG: multicopper oxidase domain-containing protein [Armatimonadetes bacterium]|nr:multicopper oxidase domain-containing protein [Armatimonadota bacterium]
MVIEFVADNPGALFHHCHNLYHLNGGMANVVRTGK